MQGLDARRLIPSELLKDDNIQSAFSVTVNNVKFRQMTNSIMNSNSYNDIDGKLW